MIEVKSICLSYSGSVDDSGLNGLGGNDNEAENCLDECFLMKWSVLVVLIHESESISIGRVLKLAFQALFSQPAYQV